MVLASACCQQNSIVEYSGKSLIQTPEDRQNSFALSGVRINRSESIEKVLKGLNLV